MKYFTKFTFRKFKMRPKFRRFFVQLKIKLRFAKVLKKIKIFTVFLKEFIEKIQTFLDSEFCKFFLPEKKLIELKQDLTCIISKETKNYVLLAWLRTFLVKF